MWIEKGIGLSGHEEISELKPIASYSVNGLNLFILYKNTKSSGKKLFHSKYLMLVKKSETSKDNWSLMLEDNLSKLFLDSFCKAKAIGCDKDFELLNKACDLSFLSKMSKIK